MTTKKEIELLKQEFTELKDMLNKKEKFYANPDYNKAKSQWDKMVKQFNDAYSTYMNIGDYFPDSGASMSSRAQRISVDLDDHLSKAADMLESNSFDDFVEGISWD